MRFSVNCDSNSVYSTNYGKRLFGFLKYTVLKQQNVLFIVTTLRLYILADQKENKVTDIAYSST